MTDNPQHTPLELLGSFARAQADRLRAEAEASYRERREHEEHEAVLGAVNEFIQRFTANGIQPPALTWTGYAADPRENQPPYRIQATAHLGEGIYLAYNRPRPGDDYGNHIHFTLVAADHPDDPGDPGPTGIRDITELAQAITRIETARHAARVDDLRSQNQ
jgi:hypothetical protein